MIKKIKFKNIKTNNDIILNFDSETNIIVGPKGGGKSTLFNLLAGLAENYISNRTIAALESFDLEFEKAEMVNGEIKHYNTLEVRKLTKTQFDHKSNRYDIISQNDIIKTQLDNYADIEKRFFKNLLEKVKNNDSVISFVSEIKDYYHKSVTFKNLLEDDSINWTNSFNMDKFQSNDFSFLYIKEFNTNVIKSELKTSITFLNQIIDSYKLFSSQLKNQKASLKTIVGKHISDNYKNNYDTNINTFDEKLKELEKITSKEINLIQKKINIINSFDLAYTKILKSIKDKSKDLDFIAQFKLKAENRFKQIAFHTKSINYAFNELTSNSKILSFDSKPIKDEILEFKIDDQITIEQPDILNLLKIVFHTPTSLNSFYAWLLKLNEKGIKDFNDSSLFLKIAKIIKAKEKAYIWAKGQSYDTLSLGEKSIFGISHKLNLNKENRLFLDQIEDNLDNKTIVEKIVKWINNKPGQKFLVTHNANVGILTNVKNVIIADNDSNDGIAYSKGLIVQQSDTRDSDLSIFLEGGTGHLENRWKIIKGEKHEN